MAAGTILKYCSKCSRSFDIVEWSEIPLDGCTHVDGLVVEMRTCECGTTLGKETSINAAFSVMNARIRQLRLESNQQPWEVLRTLGPQQALDMACRLRSNSFPVVCYSSIDDETIKAMFGTRLPNISVLDDEIESVICDPSEIASLRTQDGRTVKEAKVLVVACPVPRWLRQEE